MNIFKFCAPKRLYKSIVLVSTFIFTFEAFSNESNFPFKRLRALENKGAEVSAFAVRLDNNQVLAEISSNQHLIPASTTKLIIASQALEIWGADHKFKTSILRRGEIHNGILEGDLIFYGAGDPALINEKLVLFANDVASAGIHQVTGKLIVNNSLFGHLKQDSSRLGSKKYSENAYDSPLSAAAINYSVLGVVVTPGEKVGEKANVSTDPTPLSSIKIVNQIKTSARGTRTNLAASRMTKNGKDTIVISGRIALNAREHRVYRSVSNPDLYAGEVVAAHLKNSGIKIENAQIAIEDTPPLSTDKIVATIEGYTLGEQLDSLLKMSNNFIADMLLLKLSTEQKDSNIAQRLERGDKVTLNNYSSSIEGYMRALVKDNAIVLKSGSGLTPENQLSAKNLVSLLQQIYQDNNKFNIFLNSLTSPGQVGTLQDRFTTFSSQHNTILFKAKTGSLTEPCPVVSLAGYSQTPNGNWIGFAFIINGVKGKSTKTKHVPGIDALRQSLDADVTDFLQFEARL